MASPTAVIILDDDGGGGRDELETVGLESKESHLSTTSPMEASSSKAEVENVYFFDYEDWLSKISEEERLYQEEHLLSSSDLEEKQEKLQLQTER